MRVSFEEDDWVRYNKKKTHIFAQMRKKRRFETSSPSRGSEIKEESFCTSEWRNCAKGSRTGLSEIYWNKNGNKQRLRFSLQLFSFWGAEYDFQVRESPWERFWYESYDSHCISQVRKTEGRALIIVNYSRRKAGLVNKRSNRARTWLRHSVYSNVVRIYRRAQVF